MNAKNLFNLLCKTITARLPVMVTGAPGIGKSDIVAQAAKAANAHLIVSHPVVSDPTDFKGFPFIVDGKADFIPFGDLRALINASQPTIFFLDDLGQAPPSVQAAAMQLLLARRINNHKISNMVTFIAATNRKQDRAGVSGILEPVKSRFATIVELEPDLKSWLSWAYKTDIVPEIIAFLQFRPELLFNFEPTTNMTNSPNPRTWTSLNKLFKIGLTDFETVSGCIGQGAASEFCVFLDITQRIPNINYIIENPTTVKIPAEQSIIYAVISALAQKAEMNNFAAIVAYISRLPEEFQVVFFQNIETRNKSLKHTKTYIAWVDKHQHLFF